MATEALKDSSLSVYKRLGVAQSKFSNIGNLEPKSELIRSFFSKVALKATVVKSDS